MGLGDLGLEWRCNGVMLMSRFICQTNWNRTSRLVCVYYCRTYDKAVCGGGGGQ
jgi:hypothetical protein